MIVMAQTDVTQNTMLGRRDRPSTAREAAANPTGKDCEPSLQARIIASCPHASLPPILEPIRIKFDADLAATEANSNSSPSPSLLIIKRSTPSALHHSSHESKKSKAYLVLVRQHNFDRTVSSSTPLKSESRPHPSGLHFYQSIVQPFK